MSQLEVDKIVPQSGTTLTIGDSGDTINFADGQNINIDSNTLYIDSTNNRVGIANASPSVALDVTGTAKVSGDLTVDTNTLYVKSSTNRVGIGTTTPLENLTVESSSFPIVAISNNSATNPTNGVALDLIERNQASVVFGEAGCYGFRQFLDGNANRFDIISGNQATTNTRLSIERDTGNIGIGTTAPTPPTAYNGLVINATYPVLKLTSATSGTGVSDGFTIRVNSADDAQLWHYENKNMSFATNNAERMRIDSSGNVLVGKTVTTRTVVGAELRPDGFIRGTKDSAHAFDCVRTTDDGDVIRVYKDNTHVGSIGVVNSNNLFIQGDSTNSGLQCGTNTILPVQSGANASNTIDMGDASNLWKDIYLGGGLYVGGTGTANKLSDYEEGTWTPSFNFSELTGFSGSITTTDATYTKIGNFVSLNVGFSFSGSSGNVSTGDLCTVSGGLPFTQKGSTYGGTGGCFAFNAGSTAGISIQPRNGGFRAFITSVVGSPTRAGGAMRITFNYQTT